jgi:hypothetical protein
LSSCSTRSTSARLVLSACDRSNLRRFASMGWIIAWARTIVRWLRYGFVHETGWAFRDCSEATNCLHRWACHGMFIKRTGMRHVLTAHLLQLNADTKYTWYRSNHQALNSILLWYYYYDSSKRSLNQQRTRSRDEWSTPWRDEI